MVNIIKNLKPGDYAAPQAYSDERGQKKVRLLYFKSRTEPHRENLKDDYNRLAQRAVEEKKQAKLEKWFKEHIPMYYIAIDKEFANCASLGEWMKVAAKN